MLERQAAKITKRLVDAARPQAKLYRLWDSELKGFGVRVTPAGVKSYIVAYRPGAGGRSVTQQEFTIGRHGVLTPDEARAEAVDILASVRRGGDPQALKVARRKELDVTELCDLYLREGVTTKKPSTLATDRMRIARHIKPLLGAKPVSTVTAADIERFVRDVAAGQTAVQVKPTKIQAHLAKAAGRKRTDPVARGGRGTATRTTGLLGAIFTFAVSRKLRPDNPVRGVKRFKDRQSQRFLSREELGRLGVAFEALGPGSKAAAILRLLVMTGARKGEIEGLRWEAVDLPLNCLRLADSKTGSKIIPLGAAPAALLAKIERRADSPFVFPSDRDPKKHFVGTPKIWRGLRAAAGLDQVRIHDLRHTFASLAVADGQSLQLIGKILGHRDLKTTLQYAHLADGAVQSAANLTSSVASKAMGQSVQL